MARSPVSEGDRPTRLPHLYQSRTHPGDVFWAWARGTAPWIPLLGGAQSWSCGISCKESQIQKGPGNLSALISEGVIAMEGEGGPRPVPTAPSSQGQGLGSLPGPPQLQEVWEVLLSNKVPGCP